MEEPFRMFLRFKKEDFKKIVLVFQRYFFAV